MTRPRGRRARWLRAGAGIGLLALGGCARALISPLAVPPYRIETAASYDDTWKVLVRTVMTENLPLRVVAKDSGVIASDDFVSPIGVDADCGRFGDTLLEGDALISFTVFVQPGRDGGTRLQVNAKMRTQSYRRGPLGILTSEPVYQCVSTSRWEANLRDAVRGVAKE
jgi:hypothetical protein